MMNKRFGTLQQTEKRMMTMRQYREDMKNLEKERIQNSVDAKNSTTIAPSAAESKKVKDLSNIKEVD